MDIDEKEIRALCRSRVQAVIEEFRCDPILLRCFLDAAMIEVTMEMVKERGTLGTYYSVQKIADACAAPQPS